MVGLRDANVNFAAIFTICPKSDIVFVFTDLILSQRGGISSTIKRLRWL